MTNTDFEFLLSKIGPKIKKKHTTFRRAIPTAEPLAVTLRFFASGDSYHFLKYTFNIWKPAIPESVTFFLFPFCLLQMKLLFPIEHHDAYFYFHSPILKLKLIWSEALPIHRRYWRLEVRWKSRQNLNLASCSSE
nr:unnamed protein product [Callosobruchus chinensis]